METCVPLGNLFSMTAPRTHVAVWSLERKGISVNFLKNHCNLMTCFHSANTLRENTASTYFSLVKMKMHTGTVAIVFIPYVHFHTKITGHLTLKKLFYSTLQTNIGGTFK